jgi:hypothetical protein
MKKISLLLILSMLLVQSVHARTNRPDVMQTREDGWTVAWGKHIDHWEYAKLAACMLDPTTACINSYLTNLLKESASTLGTNVAISAIKDRGRLFTKGNLEFQAGIATYNRWHGENPCSLWGGKCWFKVAEPNTHQPFVRWRSRGSSGDSTNLPAEVPTPGKNLRAHHSGCNALSKSRSPDCVAAIHRFCADTRKIGAGVSQEIGTNVFGVACFQPKHYGDVSLSTLKQHHGGCNDLGKSQHPDCMAAIHRYCHKNRGAGAGISQEVGSGVFGVACFQPKHYGDVSLSTLQDYHKGCNSLSKSQHPDCVAAIHRYCADKHGASGGISQEVGTGVFGVACFNAKRYEDVSL